MTWQTIDSAPKDGTWVLVSPGENQLVTIGSFTGVTGEQLINRQWVKFSGWVDIEKDCWMSYGDCCSEHYNIWPTHWQPLPEAPK